MKLQHDRQQIPNNAPQSRRQTTPKINRAKQTNNANHTNYVTTNHGSTTQTGNAVKPQAESQKFQTDSGINNATAEPNRAVVRLYSTTQLRRHCGTCTKQKETKKTDGISDATTPRQNKPNIKRGAATRVMFIHEHTSTRTRFSFFLSLAFSFAALSLSSSSSCSSHSESAFST